MKRLSAWTILGLLAAAPLSAQDAERPLSAIDWLSESVQTPAAVAPEVPAETGSRPTRTPPRDEAPVARDATSPDVSVRSLDAPSPDPIGLLPPEVTGFPRTLWSGSEEDTLVALMRAERIDTLPAIQSLLMTLILAQADPPLGAGPGGDLFLARIDRLLDMGALEPAQALLEAAEPDQPELFRRWFDVSLLTGTENAACAVMQARPAIAPTPAARVFCMARAGDWSAAALTLNSARALGDIDEETAYLLARFLDPDLFEGEPLDPPTRPSPLVFRMREAIGEGMTTSTLPRAFAHADLRSMIGWKSQIEAAERLARTGAIQPAVLQGFYTSRVPSASGGVWERAAAVQALEAALAAGDPDAIGAALQDAWDQLGQARLQPVLAQLYGPDLADLRLEGAAETTRFHLMMLTDAYEAAALDAGDQTGAEALLSAVARGQVTEDMRVAPRAQPVKAAFASPGPDQGLVDMAAEGRIGEAILRTVATFEQGLDGDTGALAEALATFRALGLEDVARRAALQYLILDRT